MGLNLLACRGKTNPARPLGEATGHFWAILINYVFMENVPTWMRILQFIWKVQRCNKRKGTPIMVIHVLPCCGLITLTHSDKEAVRGTPAATFGTLGVKGTKSSAFGSSWFRSTTAGVDLASLMSFRLVVVVGGSVKSHTVPWALTWPSALPAHTLFASSSCSSAFPSNLLGNVTRTSLPVFSDKPISHSDGHTPVGKLISNIKFQDVPPWFHPITLVTLPTMLNTAFISWASVTFTLVSSIPFPAWAPFRRDQRM